MKDRSEAMRLVLTALGAGLCGAFGYGAIAHREGPPAMAPALDVAPFVAAVQDLQRTLRTATFAADSAAPARAPVVDAESSPTPATPGSGDLDAAIARFTVAVQSCSERLDKLATENRGSQQLAEMVQEMARLPVTTPPRWDALQTLVALENHAMQGVGYLTPEEVLQRFGGPSNTRVEKESATISWIYSGTESWVIFHFLAGHVVKVEADRR